MTKTQHNIAGKVRARLAETQATLLADYRQTGAGGFEHTLQQLFVVYLDVIEAVDSRQPDAQSVGGAFAALFPIQQDFFNLLQNKLANELTRGLTAAERAWLLPRFTRMMSEMSAGYCHGLLAPADKKNGSVATLPRIKAGTENQPSPAGNLPVNADENSRYRIIAESACDFIFIIDKNDHVEYMNQHAWRLFRWLEDNPAGMARSTFFSPASSQRQQHILASVFETGKAIHRQEWTELHNGETRFLDTHLAPLWEHGRVRAVLGISRDLTEQKISEQKAIEQHRKYHTLLDALHNVILILDNEIIIDCNRAATEVLAQEQSSLIGRHFCALFANTPAWRQKILYRMRRCLTGQVQHFELEYSFPNNEKCNFEVQFSRFPQNDDWQVLAILRDITRYKRANAAAKMSESRFSDIIRRSLDGYFFLDVNFHLTQLNQAGETILTYTKEEMNELFFSENENAWNIKLRRLVKQALGGKSFAWEEFEYLDKNSEPRWVAINIRRVYDRGIVSGVEGFIKDITQRKKIEMELIESEARYRALFESIPFDVFGLTLTRRFLKVNQNFANRWGEVEQQKIHAVCSPELAGLLAGLCSRVEKKRQAAEASYDFAQNDGIRHFRIIMAPIITEKNAMIGFAGLIIDITDTVTALAEKRTFAEKLVQTSEEEQRRISREIHDSLGQILFALQLELTSAKLILRQDVDKAEKILANSEALLSKSMKEASNLCYRLSPRLLDDFGLVEALEDLFENIEKTGALAIHFEKSGEPRIHNKSIEMALFRVTQEAFANILKHSAATDVDIRLEANSAISLSIKDNGRGFNLKQTLASRKRGFGLMNMKERVEIIGGQLTVDSAHHEGTKIDIYIPSYTKGEL